MSVELTVPEVGESITEVQIGRWLKPDGATVAKDDDLVEIETEKASVVLPAPQGGVLSIVAQEGAFAPVGEVIARIAASAVQEGDGAGTESAGKEPAAEEAASTETAGTEPRIMPAAARLLREHGLDAGAVEATGPGGRLLKEDVQRQLAQDEARRAARDALAGKADEGPGEREAPRAAPAATVPGERPEQVRPMSMVRRTIAARLVQAQRDAALLSTFNEVDMGPVMELRSRYKAQFLARHGVKLGFMSFFVKASVAALQRFPAVNSEVRGTDVITKGYYDVGIAVGGGKGLVVPVLRNADRLTFAQLERAIADFGARARDNKLEPAELEGGTFTISNGGIYGSLLSTPIVNPPQSAILGMHAIQERPVAHDGAVIVRPMMYLALTYDHRLIDGREAVLFLRTIKEILEEPARLFLEI